MVIQSISFVTGPHRDGYGNPLTATDRLPKMRPRARLCLRAEVKRLDSAIEYLCRAKCTYWACRGPQQVRAMVTCTRCCGIRDLVATRETMAFAAGLPSIHL